MGRLGHPSSFFSSVVVVLLLLRRPTAELNLISMWGNAEFKSQKLQGAVDTWPWIKPEREPTLLDVGLWRPWLQGLWFCGCCLSPCSLCPQHPLLGLPLVSEQIRSCCVWMPGTPLWLLFRAALSSQRPQTYPPCCWVLGLCDNTRAILVQLPMVPRGSIPKGWFTFIESLSARLIQVHTSVTSFNPKNDPIINHPVNKWRLKPWKEIVEIIYQVWGEWRYDLGNLGPADSFADLDLIIQNHTCRSKGAACYLVWEILTHYLFLFFFFFSNLL